MPLKPKKHLLFLCVFSFLMQVSLSQTVNSEVTAKLEIQQIDDVANISGKAINKTQVFKSLSYKMTLFRTDAVSKNLSKSLQEGRFTLEPDESKLLANTTVNTNTKDKLVVLLLIIQDEMIIGKHRLAYNEDEKDTRASANILQEITEVPADGLEIRGIVIDETRTKPGKDFYDAFYALYSLNKINGDKIVRVAERIAQARSTIIEVYVDDTKVAQFVTRPSYDYIESMSKESIRRVSRRFQALKKQTEDITRY